MTNVQIHICFNVIADPNWHAGNIYIFNLVHALGKLSPQERQQVKISLAARTPMDIPQEIKQQVDCIYKDTFFHLAFYKVMRMLPAFMRSRFLNFRKIDFYYPGGNLPHKWIFNWGGWIPDFQYRYLPQLFSKEEYASRDTRNAYLAKEAPILAFSSQNALDDYVKFFPANSSNAHLLRFVSNANEDWRKEDPLQVQNKFNLPDNFFMVCNQFWKHKDHHTVIEAIHLLNRQGVRITVVCTGATEDFRNPDYYPSLLKQAEELGVKDQFVVLGFISRKDQIQLIRRSLAVIQPSLFEGWSTVVEDARSLGKPVFLSDFPVHIEQNPPHSWFFKQRDAAGLAILIKSHLSELAPGPDQEKEELAYKQNHQMMADFGRRFVAMARKALNQV